jgi:hypothetical protein
MLVAELPATYLPLLSAGHSHGEAMTARKKFVAPLLVEERSLAALTLGDGGVLPPTAVVSGSA